MQAKKIAKFAHIFIRVFPVKSCSDIAKNIINYVFDLFEWLKIVSINFLQQLLIIIE